MIRGEHIVIWENESAAVLGKSIARANACKIDLDAQAIPPLSETGTVCYHLAKMGYSGRVGSRRRWKYVEVWLPRKRRKLAKTRKIMATKTGGESLLTSTLKGKLVEILNGITPRPIKVTSERSIYINGPHRRLKLYKYDPYTWMFKRDAKSHLETCRQREIQADFSEITEIGNKDELQEIDIYLEYRKPFISMIQLEVKRQEPWTNLRAIPGFLEQNPNVIVLYFHVLNYRRGNQRFDYPVLTGKALERHYSSRFRYVPIEIYKLDYDLDELARFIADEVQDKIRDELN